MEDEATSAVSQAFEQTFLQLELRIISPDLVLEILPIALHSQQIELQPGQRWRLTPLDNGLRLERASEWETESFELRPGEHLALLGHDIWLVDTRSPLLGVLEGLSGEWAGQRWELGYQPYRLGRRGSTRHNDIELNHATVSRAQATLHPDEHGHVVLLCETSSSPVQINQQALAPQERRRLGNGDTLQFGELSFRYRKWQNQGPPNYFPSDGSLPDRVGDYRVVGLLGSGAMGVVYEGQDPSGQEVAIKIPLPNLLKDEQFVQRFNREMKLGKTLNHPRLTRILHVQQAGGTVYPYMVMEKISGQCLDGLKLPLEKRLALEWARQLLEALQYLHEMGVVHRDLKPANLYRTAQGLKVADLGIAHDSATMANLTQTGTILGTPLYLDPSMLKGQACDARSDLYSAGAIFYEWLAGALPYPPDVMQILTLKMGEDLPPLHQFRPNIPEKISVFIQGLIQPGREARFPSAAAALQALKQLQASL